MVNILCTLSKVFQAEFSVDIEIFIMSSENLKRFLSEETFLVMEANTDTDHMTSSVLSVLYAFCNLTQTTPRGMHCYSSLFEMREVKIREVK